MSNFKIRFWPLDFYMYNHNYPMISMFSCRLLLISVFMVPPFWCLIINSFPGGVLFRRVVLTTSNEWGALVTKLNVPADWKGFSFCSRSHSHLSILGVHNIFLFVLCRVADLRAASRALPGISCCILHILPEF